MDDRALTIIVGPEKGNGHHRHVAFVSGCVRNWTRNVGGDHTAVERAASDAIGASYRIVAFAESDRAVGE